MSRIGRSPIAVPSGVSVAVGTDNTVTVKGPQGELARSVPAAITIRQDGDVLVVERPDDQRQNRALHGLTRSLVANMVAGVTEGFSKELEIVGVGYRAIPKGPSALELALGFSHPVNVSAPDGVTFEVPSRHPDHRQGDRQGEGRPSGRGHPQAAQARALQGQGRPLRWASGSCARPGRQPSNGPHRSQAGAPPPSARPGAPSGARLGRAPPPGRVPLQQAHLRPADRRRRRPDPGRRLVHRGRPAGSLGRQHRRRRQRWAAWSPRGPRPPASPPWSSTVADSPITGGWPPWPTPPVPKDWSSRTMASERAAIRRAHHPGQPGVQGGQGRSPVLLRRPHGGGRRQRQGGPGLRQGQRGRAGRAEGHRGGPQEHVRRAPGRHHHHPPDRGRERCRTGHAEAGRPRYRA